MIRLNNNNDIQNLILTLTENKVGTSDYYLLECTNQTTNDVAYSILFGDSSEFKQRYNQFYIILNENNDNKGLSHNMYLPYTGFYNYRVLETTLTEEQYNDLADAAEAAGQVLGELENGLLWLIPNGVNNTEYNPADTTTFVYTPE